MAQLFRYFSAYCLFVIIASGCTKKDIENKYDSSSYRVEGYLLNRSDETPISNKEIALTQNNLNYAHNDPSTTTDSTGYFIIIYTPVGDEEGLTLYPTYPDYSCIFSDIGIITNIPKGENVNLKKILY